MEQVSEWVAQVVAPLRVVGKPEQVHLRPWSTVLRFGTDRGYICFKAAGSASGHEPAVLELLSRSGARCMPEVLATDARRGWIVLADGGTRLREVLEADRDVGRWEWLLPMYAQVQIEMAGQTAELFARGVPDHRLTRLAGMYRTLMDDARALCVGDEHGLTADQRDRLVGMQSMVAAMCERLCGCGVPEMLHHGDLHDGNIFVSGGKISFFDWGDSCVAHPFFSMRTV